MVNPYFIDSRNLIPANRVFGRDAEIEAMWIAIQNNQSVLLHGQARVGKTAVLNKFAQLLRQQHRHVYWIDLRMNIVEKPSDIINLIKRIQQRPYSEGDDAETFAKWLMNESFSPPVLLIDEFDALEEYLGIQDNLYPWFRNLSSYIPCVFVITKVFEYMLSDGLSKAFSQDVKRIQIKRLEDTSRLIEQEPTIRFSTQIIWTEEARTNVVKWTDHHPALTQLLCYLIYQRAIEENTLEVTGSDVIACIDQMPGFADSTFRWIWDNLGTLEQYVLYRISQASDSQISADRIHEFGIEIAEFLSGVKIADIESLHLRLEKMDLLKASGRDQYYVPTMPLLIKWVQTREFSPESFKVEDTDNLEAKTARKRYKINQVELAVDSLKRTWQYAGPHRLSGKILSQIYMRSAAEVTGQKRRNFLAEAKTILLEVQRLEGKKSSALYMQVLWLLSEEMNDDPSERFKLLKSIVQMDREFEGAYKLVHREISDTLRLIFPAGNVEHIVNELSILDPLDKVEAVLEAEKECDVDVFLALLRNLLREIEDDPLAFEAVIENVCSAYLRCLTNTVQANLDYTTFSRIDELVDLCTKFINDENVLSATVQVNLGHILERAKQFKSHYSLWTEAQNNLKAGNTTIAIENLANLIRLDHDYPNAVELLYEVIRNNRIDDLQQQANVSTHLVDRYRREKIDLLGLDAEMEENLIAQGIETIEHLWNVLINFEKRKTLFSAKGFSENSFEILVRSLFVRGDLPLLGAAYSISESEFNQKVEETIRKLREIHLLKRQVKSLSEELTQLKGQISNLKRDAQVIKAQRNIPQHTQTLLNTIEKLS